MLDRLPAELLHNILQRLAPSDDNVHRLALRNLRLMNRLLADLAAPLLFDTIPLWLSLQSLTNLSRLSEHEHLWALSLLRANFESND